MWHEISKDGLPEIDEFVLWRREDGVCFVREIDKDDYAWWNGEGPVSAIEFPKCLYWMRIPDICPSQAELWEKAYEEIDDLARDQPGYALPWSGRDRILEPIKSQFFITRKEKSPSSGQG